MKKEKAFEAILVISTGLLLFYFITHRQVFLYSSFIFGAIGVFVKPLATWIAIGWYKVGELLGMIVSKVILTVVFFFLLVPIALLYRLFNKDPLRLKKQDKSNWSIREHVYSGNDLKNTW
jgi:hypothetical protein